MMKYEFPYTGSGGKGDGWAGAVYVELTDDQAQRLEASIASKQFDDFEDDPSLNDIRQLVWEAAINDTVENYSICDLDYLQECGDEGDSLEECAEKLLESNGATIHYPGTEWW